MRTVSIRLEDLKKLTIPIGFVGENQYTQVRIDSSSIYDEYPNATPGLTVTPPIGDPYPATVTRDGAIIIWNVSASDLTNDGSGEIQLSFIVDEMVAKSYKGRINILSSIIPSGTTPTPIANWIEYAQAVLGMFTEMTAEAETLPEGSAATVELIDENGHKVLLFGIPKGDTGDPGQPGDDGYSPTVSVEDITGGHRVTITDVNGSHVFEVMDGEDGQDGYSPTVSVSNITGGHRITITDKNGTKVVDVMDGVQGEPGDDGYSPTATVTKNGSTATITVTDKNGTTTASVSDGDPTTLIDDTSTAQNKAWSAKKTDSEVGSLKSAINVLEPSASAGDVGKVLKAKTVADGKVSEYEFGSLPSVPVQDVQVNGTSILNQGVANVPMADSNTAGTIIIGNGLTKASTNKLTISPATAAIIKTGAEGYNPIAPGRQHLAVFYGLAKLAGADMASLSGETVGQYPEAQKKAICKMIGVPYPHGELIRDYTTTADQTEVTINTDESNQSFELVKVKIIVVIPSTTTEAASNFFADVLTINELNGNDDTYRLPTLQSPAAGRTFFYEFETYGGYLTFSRAYYGSGFNSTINNFNTFVADKTPRSITGFKLSQYSSTTSLVPSGTRIRIYGMRA